MVDTSTSTWLVLLDPDAAPDPLRGLRAAGVVLATAPPRLALVAAADPAPLRLVPGVRRVVDSLDESLLGLLDPEEVLLARAFARPPKDPAARAGDGLSWDAAGFSAPDDQGDHTPRRAAPRHDPAQPEPDRAEPSM